jgi:hypothetical protein
MPPAATTSSQALGNLQTFQGQMQSGQDIYNGQKQALGVDQAGQQVSGLRQAITNTTNLLNQVAPSVYGRTQNSLVTDAQATKQIGNEQAPLNTQLNKESTDESNAASNYSNLLGQATTLSDLQDKTQQEKLTGLQGIYQSLYGQEKDAASAKAAADQAAEAKRQFDTSQNLEQQKLTEQQRQFNNTPKGPAAKTPTTAEQLQSAVQGMNGQLRTVAGGDGYVSPQNYAKGLSAWAAAGLDPNTYDTYMAPFRNPGNGAYWLVSKGKYSSGNT